MALPVFTFKIDADYQGTTFRKMIPFRHHEANDGTRYHRDLASYRMPMITGDVTTAPGEGTERDALALAAFFDSVGTAGVFTWKAPAAEVSLVERLPLKAVTGAEIVRFKDLSGGPFPRYLDPTALQVLDNGVVQPTGWTLVDNETEDVGIDWTGGAASLEISGAYRWPMFFMAAPQPRRLGGLETLSAVQPRKVQVALTAVGPGAAYVGTGVLP